MRHPSKFAVHILRALVNANPTFCMAFIAILAITLAGITINALVTITLATINERQCAVHQLKYTQLPHHANQFDATALDHVIKWHARRGVFRSENRIVVLK